MQARCQNPAESMREPPHWACMDCLRSACKPLYLTLTIWAEWSFFTPRKLSKTSRAPPYPEERTGVFQFEWGSAGGGPGGTRSKGAFPG